MQAIEACGGVEVQIHSFLTSGQPGTDNSTFTEWEAEWVDPRAIVHSVEKRKIPSKKFLGLAAASDGRTSRQTSPPVLIG